jgi:serine/threonine-protein kinase
VLTKPDVNKGERDHFFPSVLPGGAGLLFTVYPAAGGIWNIAVLDTRTGEQRTVIRDGRQAQYVETGHVIYIASGTLWAVRFDLVTLATSGDPVPVLQGVMSTSGAANFSVSGDGSLIYAPQTSSGALDKALVWVSRDGRQQPIAAPARRYSFPRLSPDNTRVAVRIDDDQERNLWIVNLGRQTLMRLTPEGPTFMALWAPGGSIIFSRGRDSALFRKTNDGLGTEERLTAEPDSLAKIPTSVSPDGTRLVYHQYTTAQDAAPDLMMLKLDGTHAIEPLLQTEADERNAEISPDGRWLAYDSSVSGRVEVYVRPFPNVNAGLFQISTAGGRTPAWATKGGELFFVSGTRLMAAAVDTSRGFVADSPKVLFDNRSLLLDARTFATGAHRTFDVSDDAQRFLVLKDSTPVAVDETASAGIIVVQNWHDELRRMVPRR